MGPLRRLTLAAATLVALCGHAWASSPTEQLHAHTDRVVRVLENPALTAPERLRAVRMIASDTLDVVEAAKRALGPHWPQRTPAEREEFVQLFRDLLERAYLPRIGEYGGERIKFVSEHIDGDRATVRALVLTRKGTEVPVESRLIQKGDRGSSTTS